MDEKKTVGGKKSKILILLTLIFIVLKLTGYITWSWLWVLSPLWIFLVLFCVAFFLTVLTGSKRKK